MIFPDMESRIQHTSSRGSEDRLLSREEVEARFGIPKRFLELAVARQNGPRLVRIGGLVRYRVSDILVWLDQQTSDQ